MSHTVVDQRGGTGMVSEQASHRVDAAPGETPIESRISPAWPIVAGAACVAIPTIVGFIRALALPQPQNPWEAASVVEAWRSANGLPVYEPLTTGHATMMHGPLAPWLLGLAFRLTGTAMWTGRALQLLAAGLLIALLVTICARSRAYTPAMTVAAVALFLALDPHAFHYFVENRPDMVALLLGGIALTCMWRGVERRHNGAFVAGIALLLLAMLFKQTMLMLAAVPVIPLVLDTYRDRWARAALSAAPLVAAVAMLFIVKFTAPVVYLYMIAVPSQYPITPSGLVEATALLAEGIPMFAVCALAWLARGARPLDRLMIWVLSALAVTVPASIMTYGKVGGAPNSLLPALLAMAMFCALYLPELLAPLRSGRLTGAHRVSFAAAVGLVVALGGVRSLFDAGRDRRFADYSAVVSDVAALAPKRVIAPEDPTIPLTALGTPSRSIYLEYDAMGWPRELPQYLADEMRAADYVVDVRKWWQDVVTDSTLRELGFEQVKAHEHYGIWRRK